MSNHSHEHSHSHEHNYEHCCENHTPDNHGCSCCGHDRFEEHKKENRIKIILSAVFFVAGYICAEFAGVPEFVYKICFIISYLLVGFQVVKNAVEGIIHGRVFDENFLMTVASIGAFAIKEYSEGVAVMLLFAIGEHIQGMALSKSRKSIDDILSNDYKIYSLPRHYDNEQSQTEQFITKFARIYTPAVCLISVMIMIIPPLLLKQDWREWIYRGLAALVVSCPCAIVISVPLCYSGGISTCSRMGAFIKNTSGLDDIAKCDVIINRDDNKTIDDIKALQRDGASVLYAGDGISDMKLLEACDIPVAVGEFCTKEAVEISDMVVRKEDMGAIDNVKRIARRIRSLAFENIVLCIVVKAIILILDVILAKELPMWLAVFGDAGICLIAIANSSRSMKK